MCVPPQVNYLDEIFLTGGGCKVEAYHLKLLVSLLFCPLLIFLSNPFCHELCMVCGMYAPRLQPPPFFGQPIWIQCRCGLYVGFFLILFDSSQVFGHVACEARLFVSCLEPLTVYPIPEGPVVEFSRQPWPPQNENFRCALYLSLMIIQQLYYIQQPTSHVPQIFHPVLYLFLM